MANYNDMCRTVLEYYTTPESLAQYGGWDKIFDPNNTYSLEQAYNAIRNNPDIQIIERTDGTVVGWWSKSTGSGNLVSDIGSLPNSNTAGGTNAASALTNIETTPEITEVASGSYKISNRPKISNIRWEGAAGVSAAIIAVATGLSLGATIDKALYEAKPWFLSDEALENLNPENWKQISSIVDEQWTEMGYPTIGKIGRRVFDTILGIDSTDNSTQMYIDEDAYAYMAWYLQQQNVFSGGATTPSDLMSVISNDGCGNDYTVLSWVDTDNVRIVDNSCSIYTTYEYIWKFSSKHRVTFVGDTRGYRGVVVASDSGFSFDITENHYDKSTGRLESSKTTTVTARSESRLFPSQYPVYTLNYSTLAKNPNWEVYPTIPLGILNFYSGSQGFPDASVAAYITYSDKLDGVGQQSDATLPDFSTATDLESFKTLLKQQYPDVWTNSVTRDVLQPDGTLKTFTYVPVPTPNATDWMDTEPTGDGSQQSQKDTVVNPDMDDSIKDTISSSGSTGTTNPNPPDTGGGDSPIVVPPVGKASSLWSIYNPTLEQVNQFGSWLWSSDFVEQLKKLFSDPMQAIIGLHKVYSPVQTSGQGTIKCGYLDSEVPSKLVSEQYVTVDCGSVDLQEYFGNVFDYPPYTEVSIYLPFIGVRQLDPSDVMRSTISVKYHVDVLTGACLAEVNVQRDAAGGTLYTFSGDAAVRYPVSSGSYMGIVSGLIGVATSVVSGNLLPAIGGVTRLHTNVDRSGSFTGNAGAMGSKIPYLIISRPQTAMAENFETLSGYPSNTYTPLSACTGFTQVKFCHVENLTATDAEKQEIERLLKEGVIL